MKNCLKTILKVSVICSLIAFAYFAGKETGYDKGAEEAKKRFDEEYIKPDEETEGED